MKEKEERLSTALGARESAEQLLRELDAVDNPGALVASLAPHDLIVAWNQADDEQRADLLRLASPEQTALLIDLECWRGDVPDMEALEKIVAPLALSGVDGAQQIIRTLGDELRTLLFKSHARVHLLEDRNEEIWVPDESELIVCPDRKYHVEFPDPDLVTDVERAAWNALLLLPFEEYQPELECVLHDLSSELEEAALRWRTGRLADCGFATREEAISILAPRSLEEVVRLAERGGGGVHPVPSDIRLPVLYRENFSGNRFLDRVVEALQEMDDPEAELRLEALGAELAAMTNYFLTACAVPIGDVESVARGIRRGRDILALGLSEAARGDVGRGVRLLMSLVPGTLLQAGLGLVYPLRDRARALLDDRRFASGGQKGALFDPPYYVGLTCLAQDIPCRWPPLDGAQGIQPSLFMPRPEDLEAFSSGEELAAADRLLREAENLDTLLFEVLAFREPPLRETPASMLVLTALANAVAGREPRPEPVTLEEARVWGEQAAALQANQFLEDALAVLAPPLGVSPDGPESLEGEPDPGRRLLMRLILIGHARLLADAPERVILVEPV